MLHIYVCVYIYIYVVLYLCMCMRMHMNLYSVQAARGFDIETRPQQLLVVRIKSQEPKQREPAREARTSCDGDAQPEVV